MAIGHDDLVYDISSTASTMADLLDRSDAVEIASRQDFPPIAPLQEVLQASHFSRRTPDDVFLLSPVDLQPVKACGVTFAANAVEQAITQRARASADSGALRARLIAAAGRGLEQVAPGSDAAMRLKQQLVVEGLWSAYLEVAIGPDPELFHKACVLSSVATGEQIGFRRASKWHQSEPEVVLLVSSARRIVGATLGNDTDLRDFEERSAYLVAQDKDNNASCALGPWIRLFDDEFSLERLLSSRVNARISGTDGVDIHGGYALDRLSRDPRWLVEYFFGEAHQYPDGLALFLGCGWVPTMDRAEPSQGFTHLMGDRVEISNEYLGTLVNWTGVCEELPPWQHGIRALWRNLGARRLG